MRKLNTALLILGLAFLAYLVWAVGPQELLQEVCDLGWGVIPLILCEGLANVVHTVGWRHCIGGRRPRLPLPRLFRMAMAGYSINYLTPTASVGGEVSKAALLASSHKGPEAVGSVLLDKLTTALAHVLLAVLGSLFLLWRVQLPKELWIAMAVTSGLLTLGMVTFLWIQKYGKLGGFLRWLVDHRIGGAALRRAAGRISEVDESLKRVYRERPLDLVLSVFWHVIGHSAALLEVWLFLWLLDQPAPLATVAGAGFLALWFDLLTFAIPLNAGTLEGSRILAFKAVGGGALLGMTFGVATRIAQLFWACFGLVNYALFTTCKPRRTADQTAPPRLPPLPNR